MAKIKTVVTFTHITSGLVFTANKLRTSGIETFETDIVDLTDDPVVVDYQSVLVPRLVAIKLVSGADVRVGLDNNIDPFTPMYPFRLSGVGDAILLPLNVEELYEISTITAVADVGGALGGLYFDLEDKDGPVRAWFQLGGSTAPSTPSGGRRLVIPVTPDSSAETVAAAIAVYLGLDQEFSAEAVDDLVTITDANIGERTDISAGTSAMDVDTIQEGKSPLILRLKGLGPASQVVVAVAP
jgi:hypothetical protein